MPSPPMRVAVRAMVGADARGQSDGMEAARAFAAVSGVCGAVTTRSVASAAITMIVAATADSRAFIDSACPAPMAAGLALSVIHRGWRGQAAAASATQRNALDRAELR